MPADEQLSRMLEARSVAVVGASERAGSFGLRLATEALRSPSMPEVFLVHPTRRTVLGRPCFGSLADVPRPVDLVLLGVPDSALVAQVSIAAGRGDGGAVVFGSAVGLGQQVTEAAGGLALCGGGCMGFVNVARGLRAIGYLERHPLVAGGIAMISHSGSVFSALLRTHRRLEFCLAVSSGQELVTTTADYLWYALGMPETRVVGLFLETLRDVGRFREGLARAGQLGIPVVALTVGGSRAGRVLVEAHSGALAGADVGWEALFASYGVHRVEGLDELVDSLEALSIGRRVAVDRLGSGIATVHDSGAERVLVADVAQHAGVRFAEIGEETRARLRPLIAPGLEPVNPLDVWSTGGETTRLVTECLSALADDDQVGVVALAVDLVPEYDGDTAYPQAVEAAIGRTDKPVVVLANLSAAVDQSAAGRLRAVGVPVLEGTRSGIRTLGHLLARRPSPLPRIVADRARVSRWHPLLASGPIDQASAFGLLRGYGIATVPSRSASTRAGAIGAAEAVGYPVVLKTDDPAIAHKAVVGGVVLGLADASAVAAAYDALAARLGPDVTVQPMVSGWVEIYVGLIRVPLIGPVVLVAPGGNRVEAGGHRAARVPPVGEDGALSMLRDAGMSSAGLEAVVTAILGVSQIGVELGDLIDALDVNPLIIGPEGALAVDALLLPSPAARSSVGPAGAG